MTPRCIAIRDTVRRCPRPAAVASGDIYTCREHSRLITMAIIADWLAAPTRRMLAFAKWETVVEGRRLINELHRRRAA